MQDFSPCKTPGYKTNLLPERRECAELVEVAILTISTRTTSRCLGQTRVRTPSVPRATEKRSMNDGY